MKSLIWILAFACLLFDGIGNFGLRVYAGNFHLAANNASKAAEFALKDQYDNSIEIKFPRDKTIVLVFGDREGSSQIEGWVRPIYEKYTDQIEIYGIAELSAVPSLARPIVRRIFKRNVKHPVMLDWSGEVSKNYGYTKGKANVFVINRDGRIIAEKRGAAASAHLNDIYNKINNSK